MTVTTTTQTHIEMRQVKDLAVSDVIIRTGIHGDYDQNDLALTAEMWLVKEIIDGVLADTGEEIRHALAVPMHASLQGGAFFKVAGGSMSERAKEWFSYYSNDTVTVVVTNA